jgi:hypothetical protein
MRASTRTAAAPSGHQVRGVVGRRVLAGLAALAVCAAFLAYPADAAPPEVTMSKAGCADAGPRTRDFLPQFTDGTRTVVNPCLGLSDLTGVIVDLIPEGQRNTVEPFVAGIKGLVAKVLAINALAECGYRTDRLALGIYQDRGTRWSVGVVAVTRGRVDAVLEISKCYLLDQLPFRPGYKVRSTGPVEPQPKFCVQTLHRFRGGQDYTLLWLGSSDVMCANLGAQLTPGTAAGNGVTATVKASPNVNVRAGTSTRARAIRREPAGQTVIVTCYRTGQTVSGRRGASNRWYRLQTEGGNQYISGAWLDTGDRPDQPAPCR